MGICHLSVVPRSFVLQFLGSLSPTRTTLKVFHLSLWHQLSSLDSPTPGRFQKSWSGPVYRKLFHDLLTEATEEKTRKSLKSFEGKIQSAWLTAFPSSSLGLKLSNVQLRISLALRLGVNLCETHVCRCGEPVEASAGHGVSCRKSAG